MAPHRSWYEPLTDEAAIARAVRYVLADGQRFLNSTADDTLLPAVFAAAAGSLDAPSDDELAADVEAFAISSIFDGGTLERI